MGSFFLGFFKPTDRISLSMVLMEFLLTEKWMDGPLWEKDWLCWFHILYVLCSGEY